MSSTWSSFGVTSRSLATALKHFYIEICQELYWPPRHTAAQFWKSVYSIKKVPRTILARVPFCPKIDKSVQMSKPIFFHQVNYMRLHELQNINKLFWDVPNRRSVERPMGTSFLFVCSSYLYQLFVLCFLLLCFLQSPRNTLSKTQQPSHVNAINTFERLYQLLTAFINFRHRHHRLQIK